METKSMKKFLISAILAGIAAGSAAAGPVGSPRGKALDQLVGAASPAGIEDIQTPKAPVPARGSAEEENTFIKGAMPPGAEFPDPAAGRAAGATKFDTFKALFENGRPATKEELTGWHSGRYVCRSRPDTVYGAIMVGSESYPDGPALPSKFRIGLPGTNTDPVYFDVLDENKVAAVKKSMSLHGVELTFPAAMGTYVYSQGTAATIYTMEYRKSGGYIIEKMGGDQPFAGYTLYMYNVTPKADASEAGTPAEASQKKPSAD